MNPFPADFECLWLQVSQKASKINYYDCRKSFSENRKMRLRVVSVFWSDQISDYEWGGLSLLLPDSRVQFWESKLFIFEKCIFDFGRKQSSQTSKSRFWNKFTNRVDDNGLWSVITFLLLLFSSFEWTYSSKMLSSIFETIVTGER